MFRIQVECDRAADTIRPFIGERVKDIRRSYVFFNTSVDADGYSLQKRINLFMLNNY